MVQRRSCVIRLLHWVSQCIPFFACSNIHSLVLVNLIMIINWTYLYFSFPSFHLVLLQSHIKNKYNIPAKTLEKECKCLLSLSWGHWERDYMEPQTQNFLSIPVVYSFLPLKSQIYDSHTYFFLVHYSFSFYIFWGFDFLCLYSYLLPVHKREVVFIGYHWS